MLKFFWNVRWSFGRFGSPITVMTEPSCEPVMSWPSEVLKPGWNGVPLMKEASVLIRHPLTIAETKGFPER